MFFDHLFPQIEERDRFLQAGCFIHDPFQRIGNIADDFHFGLVIFVDVGRHRIDMDDIGVGHVPFSRGVFDDIVADGDDQAGFFQHLRLIIVHGDADSPHRIGIVKGNSPFGHHRIDNRQFQLFCKFG